MAAGDQIPGLFDADPQDADRAYRNIRNLQHLLDVRAHCEQMWAEFWPYSDRTFLADFPRDFHQRWFEMYLTVALRRAGLPARGHRPPGPDVVIDLPGRRIWIEAISPTGGDPNTQDAVREPIRASGAFWVPRPNVVLRVCHGFIEKSRKFTDYLSSGIVDPNDTCVIAINVHRIPHAALDMHAYLRAAVYAVGDPYVTLNRDTAQVIERGNEYRPERHKANQAPVAADVFLTPQYQHIAAVLGSRSDAANTPSRLGDDFLLLPNAFGRHLPPATIPLGHEGRIHQESENAWRVEIVSHLPDIEAD